MTSQALYMKARPVCSMRVTYTLNMWHHSHDLCHHNHWIDNITPTLFITSHSPYVWHRLHYTTHHILNFDLKPPFWGHHTHYIRHRVHYICVITTTLSIISQPLCVWYHIQYMWNILSTILMTSFKLCMTTQPCVFITPHSAYVCHHLSYRRRHIHSITPSHNLYDFTSISGMTSHRLYQTSHQLHLFHHSLSTAITHTFLCHHTHYMCDIICTIYNIISTAYVITLLYLWQQNVDIWKHIQYAVQNIHYPCDFTVTSLCHHTHIFERISPKLCMTSQSA